MRMVLKALLLLGLALWGTTSTAQVDTDRVVSIGRNALSFKDYVLAIQYFNTAIQYHPHQAEPYFYRALAKYNLDDLRGTEADCDACIERNPFIYQAYFLRALVRHALEKSELALQDYEQVLANNPDDQGALHNASLLYIARKDSIKARETLDRLKRFYPHYAPAYVIDGGYALSQGDTVQARALFTRGIEVAPTSHAPYASLASIAYDKRNYPEALSYLDQAIEYNPNLPDLYTHRGIINYQLNNLRGAMADYSTAIDLKPNNLHALYNRALLRKSVGELNLALEDFDKVLAQAPNNYFARFNRGLLHNQLGDPEHAVADLNLIIERYNSFVPAYVERAHAKRSMGDTRGAELDMRRANGLMRTTAPQQVLSPDSKDTRDERDENIRKFQMLIHGGSSNQGYNELYRADENIRGRVQDHSSAITEEPIYIYSYYDDIQRYALESLPQYSFEELPTTPYALKLVRHIPPLSADIATDHRARLTPDHTQQEPQLFALAMDHLTLRDYESAASILRKLILSPTPAIAHASMLQLASCLYYMGVIEKERLSTTHTQRPASSPTLSPLSGGNQYSHKLQLFIAEALSVLTRLLEHHPNNAIVLYNIGCLHLSAADYAKAISYFTQATEQEPEMGAAFYNRALCHYATGEKLLGDQDMSRAGNLGLYRAYSIIKRMQ